MYWTPGPDNSNRINTENAVPIKPENNANIRYNVPISFALEDRNHLSVHREIDEIIIFEGSWGLSASSLSFTLLEQE